MTSTGAFVLTDFNIEAHLQSVGSDLLSDDAIKELAERAYQVPRSVLIAEDVERIREECMPARIIAKFEPKKLSKKRKHDDDSLQADSLPFCCALPKASFLHLPETAAMSLQSRAMKMVKQSSGLTLEGAKGQLLGQVKHQLVQQYRSMVKSQLRRAISDWATFVKSNPNSPQSKRLRTAKELDRQLHLRKMLSAAAAKFEEVRIAVLLYCNMT